ncbi:MAG TPA: hypothetical protein VLB09_07945, partial [Nitrospiria bacterium]|nr:hypothetical protein [Nitrospiria bacterium]
AVLAVSGCQAPSQHSSGRIGLEGPRGSVDISFNREDRRRINNYYKVKAMNVPPGLAKKKKLPPGHRKQLARKGKLPPGLEKKTLPMELEQQLEFLPAGYIRLKVGGDVVLIHEDTQIIFDIIYEVGK